MLDWWDIVSGKGYKLQAAGYKLQATSCKLQAAGFISGSSS